MSQYVEENLNPQFIDKYRRLAGNFFSKKKVEWTVSTVQPYKSPQTEMGFLALLNSLYHLLPTLLALFRASFTPGHVPTVLRNTYFTTAWWYLFQRLEDTLPYGLGRTVPLFYNLFCLQRWRKLCDATTIHNALLHHGKHPDVGYKDFTSTAKAFS